MNTFGKFMIEGKQMKEKLTWHKPLVKRLAVHLDTLQGLGSGVDGSAGTPEPCV